MGNFAKALGWLFGVGAVVLAVILLIVFSGGAHPALAFKPNMPQAGLDVATALFVVTLFVERSLAAFNALIFGDKERAAVLLLLSDDAARRSAGTTALAEVMSWKERLRLLLSFVAGLFVAGAGVRTLAGLFDLSKTPAPSPMLLEVDILVTAGLIAGGSNGLAFLIQALKDLIKGNSTPGNSSLATHLATTG